MTLKKSSNSGTPYTKQAKELSAADICAIINECGKSGVTQISYRHLTISFGNNAGEIADGAMTATGGVQIPLSSLQPQQIQPEKIDDSERQWLEEEYEAELMLMDPAAYESRIAKEMGDNG